MGLKIPNLSLKKLFYRSTGISDSRNLDGQIVKRKVPDIRNIETGQMATQIQVIQFLNITLFRGVI